MASPSSIAPAATPLSPPLLGPSTATADDKKHSYDEDVTQAESDGERTGIVTAAATTAAAATDDSSDGSKKIDRALERRVRLKVDLRLCTIAGILCSLNLLDSGVISSASVTSMPADLGLTGNLFSISIFIFTVSSIAFQLPSTLAVRAFGPRAWFALITFAFGLVTLCTAFVRTWRQMIAVRVLLGAAMSGVYPGLTYLISAWYPRHEQQTRFAFLQSGEVVVLATGSIVNYGLNAGLDGRAGLAGWRYMFLVQGLIAMFFGVLTYFWIGKYLKKQVNILHFSFYYRTLSQDMTEKKLNTY